MRERAVNETEIGLTTESNVFVNEDRGGNPLVNAASLFANDVVSL